MSHAMSQTAVFRRSLVTSVLTSTVLLAAASTARAQTITNLGALAPNHQSAQATGVSADGSVVAGMSGVQFFNNMRGFRWKNGSLTNLGAFSGSINVIAGAVSADGNWLAGSSFNADATIPFRWSESGGLQDLRGPHGPDFGAEIYSISGNGSVVVGTGRWADGDRAYRWSESAGEQDLGTLPGGTYSWGAAVSANSQAVTGFSSNGTSEVAYVWTESTGMQALPSVGTNEFSAGLAISADGSVVAGYEGLYAARWSNGTGLSLGTVDGGTFSVAYSISGDGLVIGGLGDNAAGDAVATIWTESLGMVDLNTYLPSLGVDLTGWSLSVTTGISFDGTTIVGAGMYEGVERGWIVTVPAPGAAGLLGVAGLCAARTRRA